MALQPGLMSSAPMNAVIVGYIAGLLVVSSVMFFDRLKIDDPVGAVSVHLTCGIWGTLAVGIFSPEHQFLTQLNRCGCLWSFCLFCPWTFYGIKTAIGLRVSEQEELGGLDLGEHEMEAYAGFSDFSL